MLTQEGKPGHEFIIVLSGEIEVRQGGKVVAERGAGSYVGEIALLDHRPRTATVVAKTPVAIEVIGQREFAGLLAEVPELSQQLLATVARAGSPTSTPTTPEHRGRGTPAQANVTVTPIL